MPEATPARVLLVHWHPEEAEALAAPLRAAGYPVEAVSESWQGGMSPLRQNPPRVVAVSLRRLPSHGKAVAEALWSTRWGQEIPLVFLDTPEKHQEPFRQKFPAATFLTAEQLPTWLQNQPRRTEGDGRG